MTNIDEVKVVETTPWMEYVTEEVLSLLKLFLPISISGNIGIKYKNPVVASYETHNVVDDTKANAVAFTVVLEFDRQIEIPSEEKIEKE